ncbi:MAG TPA: acetyl-CoA carboxylase biotin carboxyl carrier protein [Mobilitalea sp.]|nr:acetyl-CoA carboxylase biotin carboxyl carrier protein [Mobilitalea sp.]
MDYKAILNLMKEMNHTDLTKLEVEEDGFRICIEKSAAMPAALVQTSMPQYTVNTPVPTTVNQPQVIVTNETIENKSEEEIPGKKVLSPMVGTFYAKSSPEKPTFVKVGDKVKKGQTLCIIEAMKLMNEIESEYDGEVVKVLVENETMVEFGQPLFVIA